MAVGRGCNLYTHGRKGKKTRDRDREKRKRPAAWSARESGRSGFGVRVSERERESEKEGDQASSGREWRAAMPTTRAYAVRTVACTRLCGPRRRAGRPLLVFFRRIDCSPPPGPAASHAPTPPPRRNFLGRAPRRTPCRRSSPGQDRCTRLRPVSFSRSLLFLVHNKYRSRQPSRWHSVASSDRACIHNTRTGVRADGYSDALYVCLNDFKVYKRVASTFMGLMNRRLDRGQPTFFQL